MDYTLLFRKLREEKGLTLDALARLSRCHRNTIVNVESGRRVRLKTLIQLVQKMGYPPDSDEMRSVLLLYFERITDIPFSQAKTRQATQKAIATYRSGVRQAAQQLQETVLQTGLTEEQVGLLLYAARNRYALEVLSAFRRNVLDLAASQSEPDLKVAED